MNGTVEQLNPSRGMVAVRTDEGYSIVELLGDEVEVGEVLAWSGSTPLGGETIRNLTRGCNLNVFFQNHHVSHSDLRSQLLLTP
jgi:molecular chaperone DnaK (HSP70)